MGILGFKEYSRRAKYRVSDYDRSYTTLSDYLGDKGLCIPKIDGHWSILLIDLNFKDMKKLLELEIPKFHDILVYARSEVLKDTKTSEQGPKKNGYEIFIEETIASLPKIIDDKAVRELYSRCQGDDTKLETAVEEIRNHPSPRITIEILNTIIAPTVSVWASDVVASLLVYYDQRIPKRGHTLARYKMKSPLALVNMHVDLIGIEVSFYSVQKFFRALYEAKMAFLKNQAPKGATSTQRKLIENVDIYTILYCYLLFRESKPKSYYAVVHDIIERQKGLLNREESLLYARIFD
jgi:hypothetical protein